MNSDIRTIISATCMALSCIFSVSGGLNKNARIIVDPSTNTIQVDSSYIGNNDKQIVKVVVTIENAVDLTGYMLHVEFDSTSLTFEKAETVTPDSQAKPFLEKNGGIPGPFFVKVISAQAIDIAYGVKADKGSAVSGNGPLAFLTFTCKCKKASPVKVTKAQLSDSQLTIDTIIVQ
jgi:hypothetical protein